jgi:hypothetical protein
MKTTKQFESFLFFLKKNFSSIILMQVYYKDDPEYTKYSKINNPHFFNKKLFKRIDFKKGIVLEIIAYFDDYSVHFEKHKLTSEYKKELKHLRKK